MTAMFIGLLVLSMLSRKKMKRDVVVAIIAVVIAVGTSSMLSGSMGVIVATIFASTIGMVMEKWK